MRDLGEVIDKMIAVIPQNESDLICELGKNKDSFLFSAPEQVGLRWQVTADTLYDHFGDDEPTDDWGKKLVRIWMALE